MRLKNSNVHITTTMLNTARFLANRGNGTKPQLVWHLSSVQDMIKKANKNEHNKRALQFPG